MDIDATLDLFIRAIIAGEKVHGKPTHAPAVIWEDYGTELDYFYVKDNDKVFPRRCDTTH